MARKNRLARGRARAGSPPAGTFPATSGVFSARSTADVPGKASDQTPYWTSVKTEAPWYVPAALDPNETSGENTFSVPPLGRAVYETPLFDLRWDLKNRSGLEPEALVMHPDLKQGSLQYHLTLGIHFRFLNAGGGTTFSDSPLNYRLFFQEFGAISDPNKPQPLQQRAEISQDLYQIEQVGRADPTQAGPVLFSQTLSWGAAPRTRYWGVRVIIDFPVQTGKALADAGSFSFEGSLL